MTEETAREAVNQIRTPIDKARSVAKQQEDKAKEMDDTLTVTSSGIKYSKSVRAFTEQGVAMLSSVLNSNRAIQVNIQIMRAFTKLRQMLATHDDLRRKIEEMEQKYDQQFQVVFDAIKLLLEAEEKPKPKIDGLVKSLGMLFSVIPAKAGIQSSHIVINSLDSGFHRSDDFLRSHHF